MLAPELRITATFIVAAIAATSAEITPSVGASPIGFSGAPAPSSSVESPGMSSLSHSALSTGTAFARAHAIEANLDSRHVPARDVHLPDFSAAGLHLQGPARLTYAQAPAPMGLSDIGIRNASGRLEPYAFNTTGVRGTAGFTTAQSLYVAGDGADMFGVQLNSVLTDVTLFGHSTYQFWTQDFVSYTCSSGELTFGDDIWNFSSQSGLISPKVFYLHGPNGSLVAPIFYYAVGPTFTVHYPFSVTFYLNSTLLGNRPELFFNYSVTSRERNVSGSFDYVIFNSSVGPPSEAAPVAQFQVDGFGYDPFGLVNDVEIVVVGNGYGDTTTFFQMAASLNIQYWDSSKEAYVAVPSAYNVGTDSGETCNGVAVYYETPAAGEPSTAYMMIGPSFLTGLWNISHDPGYRQIIDHLTPDSAMVLVNPGTSYETQSAQWVPTLCLNAPASRFALPNGGPFFVEAMLSEYLPAGSTIAAPENSTTVMTTALAADTTLGIYTPIIIWGNSGFVPFAISGNGSASAPYLLPSYQPGPIDSVFAAWNDFAFPVFPGLLLVGTTSWVTLTPPSFAIDFPSRMDSQLASLGLAQSTDLQIQFYLVSNVTLLNAPALSGWYASSLSPFPEGAVLFWNSSGNLIAGSTFYDQGAGLALYGGTNNTIWGNRFLATPLAGTSSSFVMAGGASTLGINESESGDLIYNNFFATPVTAFTPSLDPLLCRVECEPSSYTDMWNVSVAPAADSTTVLGTALSGSIIGTWYQGGNYWTDYGTQSDPYGILPYTDCGRITNGGDFIPLLPFSVFPVTFHETGLPTGTGWNVTLMGVTTTSYSTSLVVYLPNATYLVRVNTSAAYEGVAPPLVFVYGAGSVMNVTFVPYVTVFVRETGLVEGWTWTAYLRAVNGTYSTAVTSDNGSMNASVPTGTYYCLGAALGYSSSPTNLSVVASVEGATVVLSFVLLVGLTFLETGLPIGTPWSVTLDQGGDSTTVIAPGRAVSFTLLDAVPGPFNYSVPAPAGYSDAPSSGSGYYPSRPIFIVFSSVDGTLNGTVFPKNSTVLVGGASVKVQAGVFSDSLVAGVWPVEASAAGYLPYYNNVSVESGLTAHLNINMTAVPSASTSFPGNGSMDRTVIGILAVLVALFLILAVAPSPPWKPSPQTLRPVPLAFSPSRTQPTGLGRDRDPPTDGETEPS